MATADSFSAFKKYLEYLDELAKEKSKEIILICSNVMIFRNLIDNDGIKILEELNSKIAQNQIALIDRCIRDGYINEINSSLVSKILMKFLGDLANEYMDPTVECPKEKMETFLFTMLDNQ